MALNFLIEIGGQMARDMTADSVKMSKASVAACAVKVMAAVLAITGEQALTEGQQRVMAMLLARMTSRAFLLSLARALRLASAEEREAEVKYLLIGDQ